MRDSEAEAITLLSRIVEATDSLYELQTNWEVQARYTLAKRMARERELQKEINDAIRESRDYLGEVER